MAGDPLEAKFVRSTADCKKACLANPACRSMVSMRGDGPNCWLFSRQLSTPPHEAEYEPSFLSDYYALERYENGGWPLGFNSRQCDI